MEAGKWVGKMGLGEKRDETYAVAAVRSGEVDERSDQRGADEKGEAVATPDDLDTGRNMRYTSPCTPSDERVTNSAVEAVWFAGAWYKKKR